MNFEPVIEKALDKFSFFQIPDTPPQKLPLLESLKHRFRETKPFAEIDVLLIQHHLSAINSWFQNCRL